MNDKQLHLMEMNRVEWTKDCYRRICIGDDPLRVKRIIAHLTREDWLEYYEDVRKKIYKK